MSHISKQQKLLVSGLCLVAALFAAQKSFGAELQYRLLEGIGTIQENQAVSFSTYARALYVFLIRAAGVVAVVMLVIAGAQMAGSGVTEAGIKGAKDKIWNVVYGILGVVFAYFILNLINPNLIAFDLTTAIPKLGGEQQIVTPAPQSTPSQPQITGSPVRSEGGVLVGTCENCPDVRQGGLPVKTGANSQVDAGLAQKLYMMNESMRSRGVSWEITEAWPPTVAHKSSCHQNGTCIDANTANRAQNIDELNALFNSARESGLRPVYEVGTQGELDRLVSGGFAGTSGVDIKVISNITGPHFSIYNE